MIITKPLEINKCKNKKKMLIKNKSAILVDYINRLEELYINSWKWEGLPDTVDERYLELILCEYGWALYFNDDVIESRVCLPAAVSGTYSIYNIPNYRRAFAPNGYNAERDATNSVIIYNNYMHRAPIETIYIYAQKLTDIDLAITNNINAMKTPYFITCDEEERKTIEAIFDAISDNKPAIIGSKSLNPDRVNVLNTNAQFVGQNLYELRQKIFNDFLAFCGIEANTNDKRERRNIAETLNENGYAYSQRYVALNARRQACKQIKQIFGDDVNVYFNEYLETISVRDMGVGETNGELYS